MGGNMDDALFLIITKVIGYLRWMNLGVDYQIPRVNKFQVCRA